VQRRANDFVIAHGERGVAGDDMNYSLNINAMD